MTEPARARPKRPSSGWVFTAALGGFLVVLALLAVQMRAGRDPAIGAQPAATAAATAEPRRVLVRRIVRTTVVTHVTPAVASPPPATGSSGVPATDGAAPAPAAPAPAAPAPAAAAPEPAPAPAPAPVTTRAS